MVFVIPARVIIYFFLLLFYLHTPGLGLREPLGVFVCCKERARYSTSILDSLRDRRRRLTSDDELRLLQAVLCDSSTTRFNPPPANKAKDRVPRVPSFFSCGRCSPCARVFTIVFFFFFGRVHEGATLSTATARLFLAGDAAAYFRAGAEHQTNERAEPASAGETSNSSLISLPPCARAQALIHCSVVEAAIVVGQYLNRVICPPPSISLIREEESSSRSLL